MRNDKPNPSPGRESPDKAEGKPDSLTRRRLIAASIATAIGIALAGIGLWPLWEFLSPTELGHEQEKTTLPRSKVALGQAYLFHFRGQPAAVLQTDPGHYIALSVVCTHLGCVVKWRPEEEIFFCPCHGGKFSRTGKVLEGPPPAPLPSFPVTVQADQLVIG